jgi:alpha-L-arabinofuranosidase
MPTFSFWKFMPQLNQCQSFFPRPFCKERIRGIFLPLATTTILLVVLGFSSPAHAADQAHLLVQAGGPAQTINQKLLGQNVLFAGNGMWDARLDDLEPEAARLIKKLKPTAMRFPGGNLSDLYLWEDGLGVRNTSLISSSTREIALEAAPSWPGVTKVRLLDRQGGKYGDLGSFLLQDGNSLQGVKGFCHNHPPGATLRPEFRPGQLSWHSNCYGIIEHLQVCESLGAQPILTVNYGSGVLQNGIVSAAASRSQKIKRAAAWVAYVNGDPEDDRPLGEDEEGNDWGLIGHWAQRRLTQGHPQPYRVRYWEIGNENYGKHEVGFTSARQYGEDFVLFAQAMKWVDPEIKIGAVGLADPHGKGDADYDSPWNATVLELTKNCLDFLVLHLYYPSAPAHPHPYHSRTWFAAAMAGASQAFTHLMEIRDLINKSCDRASDIKLVVSEYGLWPADSQTDRDYSNLARALFDADLLLILLQHGQELGVDLATAWNLHGNNPTAAIRFAFSSESRIVRPQFYVYELLQTHLGRAIIPVQVKAPTLSAPQVGNVGPLQDIPALQALVTLDPPGHLNLFVLNRSLDQNLTTSVTLQQYHPQPKALVRSLGGPSPAAHNEATPCQVTIQTEELPNIGATFQYTFPAHSLTLIGFIEENNTD